MRLLLASTILALFTCVAYAQKLQIKDVQIRYSFDDSEKFTLTKATPFSIELERDGKVVKIGLISNAIDLNELPQAEDNPKREFVPVALGSTYFIPDEALNITKAEVRFFFNVYYGSSYIFTNVNYLKESEPVSAPISLQGLAPIGYAIPLDRTRRLDIAMKQYTGIVGLGTMPILADVRIINEAAPNRIFTFRKQRQVG